MLNIGEYQGQNLKVNEKLYVSANNSVRYEYIQHVFLFLKRCITCAARNMLDVVHKLLHKIVIAGSQKICPLALNFEIPVHIN